MSFPSDRHALTARIGLRRTIRRVPFLVALALLLILVILPMGVLLYATFTEDIPRLGNLTGTFTLDNYRDVLSGSFEPIVNTMLIGVGGTALALLFGCVLAWLVARTDVPMLPLVRLAGIMPLFFSSLVGAIAWALIGSPSQGYVNIFLTTIGLPAFINIYSLPGMMFVFGLYYAPYVFLFVNGALSLMNPELEEAARAHGAGAGRVLSAVTFKLAAPAILGAATLVLALVMENFPIPSVLGTPSHINTIPLQIYRDMSLTPAMPNRAAANGVVLLVILAIMVTLQRRLLTKRQFTTVTGKGFKPKRNKLGRWRWAGLGFALIYMALSVVIPVCALALAAFRPNPYIPDFWALFETADYNLQSMEFVLGLDAFRTGIVNSVVVAFGVALVGGVVYLFLSYIVHRSKYTGRRYLAYVAMWPAAVPALVIGLGFLWTWIEFPLIYGTLFILILAFVAHFLPQGFQGMSSSLIQVHGDMEESAQVAGASKIQAVRHVIGPLIRTGIISTLLLVFILSIREFSIAIFLYTTDTQLLSITIFNQWEGGGFPPVAAMSLLYMLLLFGIAAIAGKWLRVRDE